MSVLDFKAPPRRRPGEHLTIGVDAAGDLTIRLPGGPAYGITGPDAERMLEHMLQRLRAARYRQAGIAARPEAPAPEPRVICRWRRDGGRRPSGGCRRNAEHGGTCRDAAGDYTPASCLHAGFQRTRVTEAAPGQPIGAGKVHLRCANCNTEVQR